jgi:hypothetical protein
LRLATLAILEASIFCNTKIDRNVAKLKGHGYFMEANRWRTFMSERRPPFQLQMPPELKTAIEKAAAERFQTASDWVRQALVDKLKATGNEPCVAS